MSRRQPITVERFRSSRLQASLILILSHLPCRWTREPGAEETISTGTPFAYIFPFKREETPEIEIRLAKDERELEKLDVQYGPGEYRKKRKRT